MAVAVLTRACAVVAVASVLGAGTPHAQADSATRAVPDTRPWYVSTARWAKWPTLAAAVGLTVAAIARKSDANQTYDVLQAVCRADSGNCLLGPDGTYALAETEALYQETLKLDRQARNWMIGGQGFLFVSGGLFLIDLVAGTSRPGNIPFAPLEPYAAPGVVGMRWRF